MLKKIYILRTIKEQGTLLGALWWPKWERNPKIMGYMHTRNWFTLMYVQQCWEPAFCILSAYCILSAALSTASSFRTWNSSTGILSQPGASVRNSTHDKGHEEGGSAYAKAGSSLRSPPWKFLSIYPSNLSLPTFCFVLSPTPLTLRGLSPTTSLWKKS